MKNSHNVFTEHYLVPAVLFLFNICLIHVIYAVVGDSTYSLPNRLSLALALLFLGSSLFLKRQILLAGSMLFYVTIAFWI